MHLPFSRVPAFWHVFFRVWGPCQPRMDQWSLARAGVGCREQSKHKCPFAGVELENVNWQSGRSTGLNREQGFQGSSGKPCKTRA